MFKAFIKKHFPKTFSNIKHIYYAFTARCYVQRSYAQEGEDLVLAKLLNFKRAGFYVDVGAHHPRRFSNTFYFYKFGWHGINIDATPGSMKLFSKKRKRDVNVEAPISAIPQAMTYYIFEEGAYNTFSSELADRNKSVTSLVKTVELTTSRLSEILDQFTSPGQEIDFFSIDVEGFDLEVLKSNNWAKYKPRFILIEEHHFDLENLVLSGTYKFLQERNYHIRAKTDNTLFFELR